MVGSGSVGGVGGGSTPGGQCQWSSCGVHSVSAWGRARASQACERPAATASLTPCMVDGGDARSSWWTRLNEREETATEHVPEPPGRKEQEKASEAVF